MLFYFITVAMCAIYISGKRHVCRALQLFIVCGLLFIVAGLINEAWQSKAYHKATKYLLMPTWYLRPSFKRTIFLACPIVEFRASCCGPMTLKNILKAV